MVRGARTVDAQVKKKSENGNSPHAAARACTAHARVGRDDPREGRVPLSFFSHTLTGRREPSAASRTERAFCLRAPHRVRHAAGDGTHDARTRCACVSTRSRGPRGRGRRAISLLSPAQETFLRARSSDTHPPTHQPTHPAG